MRELPIPFSAPMILANYAGRKTVTRRGIAQPTIRARSARPTDNPYVWEYVGENGATEPVRLKYAAGDLCYVREAWRTFVSLDDVSPRDLYQPGRRGAGVWFEADGQGLAITSDGSVSYGPRDDRNAFGRLRAGMHLPKALTRATVQITETRVERLQDITEQDAIAEGIEETGLGGSDRWRNYTPDEFLSVGWLYPSNSYSTLWNHINGAGAWQANPWIAVYRFRFFPKNINDNFMEVSQ